MDLRPRILRHTLLSIAFVALYLALNRPEVILLSQLGFTAWYPATGLTLALLLGVNPWYAILVGFSDMLAAALIYHQPLRSFGETVGAVGGAACYAAAAYALRGPCRIDLGLRRRQDVVRYVFVTIVAALAATSIGVGCLVADKTIPWSEFLVSARGWFFGDAIALLGVAPFLLIHVFPWVRAKLSPDTGDNSPGRSGAMENQRAVAPGALAEAVGQAAAVIAVLWVMFGQQFGNPGPFYLCFLPILWIAMRHGIRRAVIGLLGLNFGIVVAMHIYPPNVHQLTKVSLLMLVVSGVGLIVGAAITERHRLGLELKEQTTYLHSLIENSPLGIAVLDRQGHVELTNPAFESLFLYGQRELAGGDLDSMFLADGEFSASPPLTPQVITGQTFRATVRRQRRDRTVLDFEIHSVPLVANGELQGAYTIYQDISERIRATEAERKNAESLAQLVQELQLRTNEMTLLKEMGSLLECSATSKEASVVVSESVQKLFPDAVSGNLHLFKSSRNIVELATRWGNSTVFEPFFAPDACWALRRGQPHWSHGGETSVNCSHLSSKFSGPCLCVPMVGQGNILGVLQLEFPSADAQSALALPDSQEARQRLAATVAGQVALQLASLQLRETLRDQSIRDPLTGLFNRRFMEESLERELLRANRKSLQVSVLYLDLDNFKRFNDTHGHDAGDLVLRSIADLLRNYFRSDDICCRLGGEEFGIILPEASAEHAAWRANGLRDAVRNLKLPYHGQILETVTLSIGVAAFPDHGATSGELLKAADRCLYMSKTSGRDAVTVASELKI